MTVKGKVFRWQPTDVVIGSSGTGGGDHAMGRHG